MTPDVNVILWNFPNNGREMVVPNEDGSYTILINSKLSDEGRLHAYEHAMKHITDNDFEKDDVQTIEANAHSSEHHSKAEGTHKYADKIKEIQRRRSRIKTKMKEDEKRINFLLDHGGDMFSRAEHYYLYGKNL